MATNATWCSECLVNETIECGWTVPTSIIDGDWHRWESIEERANFEPSSSPIGKETIEKFLSGWCNAFALALHDLTDWPIVFIHELRYDVDGSESDSQYSGVTCLHHAACVRPDGSFIDIRGQLPNASAMMLLDMYEHTAIQMIYPTIDDEIRNDVPNEAYDLAKQILLGYPTFYGLQIKEVLT